MREYKIIGITGASYFEISDTLLFSSCSYTTARCKIYIQKFFDGDIIMATLNPYTMEGSYFPHVISIDKVIDTLVACNEDFIPYIYK